MRSILLLLSGMLIAAPVAAAEPAPTAALQRVVLLVRDRPAVVAFYLDVLGYKEEGTTTTPFDMAVRNDIDRFRLVMDIFKRFHLRIIRASIVKPDVRYQRGQLIRIPIAHADGNYRADAETLKRLEGDGRVAFRYVTATGERHTTRRNSRDLALAAETHTGSRRSSSSRPKGAP